MLSVVCWKWGTLYGVEYVNRLRAMLDRHLHIPHQLYCITEDPTGLDYRTLHVPMFEETFSGMTSPSGKRANFRRLQIFNPELACIWGPRILQLDLDIVITGDVTPLFSRTEPLLAFDQRHMAPQYAKPVRGWKNIPKFNPSMILMDTGVLGHLWTEFTADPAGVWEKVKTARIGDGNNSDQAVFGYYAIPLNPVGWGPTDGVWPFYKVKVDGSSRGNALPDDCRAVLFFGPDRQDDPKVQQDYPWIREHWLER